jgi:hypothetical protein
MRKLWLSIALIALFVRPCSAASDSVVMPAQKNVLLTGFSGTFFRVGTAALGPIGGWFVQQGYQVTTWIRTDWNSPTPPQPTNNSGYYTVDDFKAALTQGNLGVLFSIGHAGDGGIAVEHFSKPGDLTTRWNYLITTKYDASRRSSGGRFPLGLATALPRRRPPENSCPIQRRTPTRFLYYNLCQPPMGGWVGWLLTITASMLPKGALILPTINEQPERIPSQ